jgi:hypothetical protein
MINAFPYTGQANYNEYYPNGPVNPGYPPALNFGGPMRSNVINLRRGSYMNGLGSLEGINRASPSLQSNPTNK